MSGFLLQEGPLERLAVLHTSAEPRAREFLNQMMERASMSMPRDILMLTGLLFAVAIDISTRKSVGMGRVISDGISDAYIQDLVVLPEWRGMGVGRMILSVLLDECRMRKISWTALIAEPGTSGFYGSLGFAPMTGYVPMLLSGEAKPSGSPGDGE